MGQTKGSMLSQPMGQQQQYSQAPQFMPQPQPQHETIQQQEVPEAQVSPGKRARAAKTILYSDKSETSVEELMDDTPSNYNI